MAADPLTQFNDLAISAAAVSAVAVPLVLVGWVTARALGRRVIPRRGRFTAGWNGVDIVVLFLLHFAMGGIAYSVLTASGFFQWFYGPDFPTKGNAAHQQIQFLWASLFETPLLLLAAAGLWYGVHGRTARTRAVDVPGHVAFGAIGWAAVTPVVFVVHVAALVLVPEFGGVVEEHPLVNLGGEGSVFDRVLFGLVVCFVTPLTEEFLFRGLLVRWAAGQTFRPWVLMGVAAGMSCLSGDRASVAAPVVFIAVLTVGLVAVRWFWRTSRVGVRETASVYASAALFAAAHSAVWPSPVPLFVLGLGLGYLALRTGGITACVVLHGLFNAVSFVLLLRGGAG